MAIIPMNIKKSGGGTPTFTCDQVYSSVERLIANDYGIATVSMGTGLGNTNNDLYVVEVVNATQSPWERWTTIMRGRTDPTDSSYKYYDDKNGYWASGWDLQFSPSGTIVLIYIGNPGDDTLRFTVTVTHILVS